MREIRIGAIWPSDHRWEGQLQGSQVRDHGCNPGWRCQVIEYTLPQNDTRREGLIKQFKGANESNVPDVLAAAPALH